MKVLPGPTKSNQVLAWSPDGRFVVAGGNGDGVMVWDVDAGTAGERVLNAGHGSQSMLFCPRTGRLYVAFQSGGFWSFDPNTGEEHRRPLNSKTSYRYPAVSDDGRTIVVRRFATDGRAIVGYTVANDGVLTEIWARPDTRSGSWIRLEFTFRPHTDQLFGLRGQSEFEWTTAVTGELIGSFAMTTEAYPVKRWALAPDGDRVAWLTDRGLFLRQLDDPTTLQLPAADNEVRRGLAFHPSGRLLAYTTGPTVRLLDADTFAEVRALDWGTGGARAVAFSPDGLRAAVSAEGGRGWVTVFDLE